jgi:hypothetical protein
MLKREKYYGYLTLAVAVVQFLIQLGSIAQGEDFIVTALNTDDTFYYLLTSWNLHRYGMVTFDGLHATNGVQFLWFWILAALAAVTPTKTRTGPGSRSWRPVWSPAAWPGSCSSAFTLWVTRFCRFPG